MFAEESTESLERKIVAIKRSASADPRHKDLESSLGEVNEEDLLSQTKDFNEGVRHGDPHVSSKASVTSPGPLPLPSSV